MNGKKNCFSVGIVQSKILFFEKRVECGVDLNTVSLWCVVACKIFAFFGKVHFVHLAGHFSHLASSTGTAWMSFVSCRSLKVPND